MALKDWKKQYEKNDDVQFYNSKTGLSVFVYFQDYIEKGKKGHWVFEVADSKKTYKEVVCGNKSTAMRYAKSYMRSH